MCLILIIYSFSQRTIVVASDTPHRMMGAVVVGCYSDVIHWLPNIRGKPSNSVHLGVSVICWTLLHRVYKSQFISLFSLNCWCCCFRVWLHILPLHGFYYTLWTCSINFWGCEQQKLWSNTGQNHANIKAKHGRVLQDIKPVVLYDEKNTSNF